jgi:hypothetical protein
VGAVIKQPLRPVSWQGPELRSVTHCNYPFILNATIYFRVARKAHSTRPSMSDLEDISKISFKETRGYLEQLCVIN